MATPNQSAVLNVCQVLSRATMDAVGEAAFDYKFNAMENHDSDMVRGYNNLMCVVLVAVSTSSHL